MTEEDEFMRGGGRDREIDWTDTGVSVVFFFFSRRPSALSADSSQGQPRTTDGQEGKTCIGNIRGNFESGAHSQYSTALLRPIRGLVGEMGGYTDGVLDKARPAAKGHPRR